MVNALLIGMLILAILALVLKNLFGAVVVLSVFSLVSCLFFYVLGAPDVALTEAAVGTGIGSVVFIWIVRKTRGAIDEADHHEDS
ncbi:MAG: Na(+)/H(+) antiporter subunit B [Spirochaetales bacterium]